MSWAVARKAALRARRRERVRVGAYMVGLGMFGR